MDRVRTRQPRQTTKGREGGEEETKVEVEEKEKEKHSDLGYRCIQRDAVRINKKHACAACQDKNAADDCTSNGRMCCSLHLPWGFQIRVQAASISRVLFTLFFQALLGIRDGLKTDTRK